MEIRFVKNNKVIMEEKDNGELIITDDKLKEAYEKKSLDKEQGDQQNAEHSI